MRYLLFSLLLPLFLYNPSHAPEIKRAVISCSPAELDALFAVDVFSVKDGDWNENSTWSTGRVPSETDNITISHNLFSNNRNIIIRGMLTSRKGGIQFRGIDERNFVGSGMGPDQTPNDIGLWVMDAGKLDLQGEEKESHTSLLGSAVKGSTSITVKSATNWKVGDEIFIVPTEKPGDNIDWNDNTNTPVDPFIAKFERRIITQVAGNTLFFAQPLQYDHLAVTTTDGKYTWTAEVGNNSRSIVIEGTKTGRSHIFIRSTRSQTIRYVEGRFLGPRTPGRRAGSLVNGRYNLHFHHCMEGSQGSIVEGCSFHDSGNRVYVPHMSNGITFRKNIAFSILGEAFWWDFQDQSHSITYDGNLAALRIYDGNAGGTTGFELGQGDDNVCINNIAVYLHHGDFHQQGAYAWNADNVGVWIFMFNVAHSNRSGGFVWQNNDDPHIIEGFISYNNERGFHHGAYGNGYQFIRCIFYNAIASIEATQGSTPDQWQETIFDGGGKIPHVVQLLSSPFTAGPSNVFRQCTFIGYTKAAALMATELFQNENGRKVMDYVLPSGNLANLSDFTAGEMYNSAFRVQPASGQSYQVSKSGRTNINPWAPTFYGKGTGLLAKYYNGTNFNSLAVERIDPLVKFIQWSYDKGGSPNEVHHKITPGLGQYSITWDGYFQAWFTGPHQFTTLSYGGVRISVDNRLLIDRWTETNNTDWITGSVINLEQGKYYRIRIEHFNSGGNRGIQVGLKQGAQNFILPVSSLYPTIPGGPVQPPPANRPPVVSAGADIVTTDTILKVEGSASDPDKNLKSVKWSSSSVVLEQTLSEAAHVLVKGKPGVHKLTIKGTDELGLTASDEMMLEIKVKPDTSAPVNPCTTFIEADYLFLNPDVAAAVKNRSFASGLEHYNRYGKNEGRKINRLCIGSFKSKEQTGSAVCLNGKLISFTVPAGKYSSTSQAAADALALQEINAELAKCPLPDATFDFDNKKFYIFKEGTEYKVVIK